MKVALDARDLRISLSLDYLLIETMRYQSRHMSLNNCGPCVGLLRCSKNWNWDSDHWTSGVRVLDVELIYECGTMRKFDSCQAFFFLSFFSMKFMFGPYANVLHKETCTKFDIFPNLFTCYINIIKINYFPAFSLISNKIVPW